LHTGSRKYMVNTVSRSTTRPSLAQHPVCLQGLTTPSDRYPQADPVPPTILERTDQDLIGVLLADLSQQDGMEAIASTIAKTRKDNTLCLYQPVHQVFHIVLLEAVCDPYGQPRLQPRLDPKRIESAGLVLRRLGPNNEVAGWRQAGAKLRGWVRFNDVDSDNEEGKNKRKDKESYLDPDPTQRPPVFGAGNAAIARQLRSRSALSVAENLTETTSPLFVAPPAVCEAIGKTVLYGVIPLASSEMSEVQEEQGYELEFIRKHLPDYLQPRDSANPPVVPFPGAEIDASFVTAANLSEEDGTDSPLKRFILMLKQVQIELGAFHREEAAALRTVFSRISLQIGSDSVRLGTFLEDAARALVNQEPEFSVKMPQSWPDSEIAAEAEAIAIAAKTALDSQRIAIISRRRRFEDDQSQYHIRGFIRVRQPESCPPKLVWSETSEPFTIVPWYDTGPQPPLPVSLPNITRDSVRSLKPNVAFSVPNDLFNLLRDNTPEDFLEENVRPLQESGGGGLILNWICGFNIPIITICAFIVLSIFLQLFNIIFWWLPFIRICIPIPRRSDP
ncbi:MAG: hypothetical protein AB4042_10350, partial [Leptolyngbyaceae cyanobacterium]